MDSYPTLLDGTLKLKPVERIHLIDGLMASLEKPDPDIEKLCEDEALKRFEAYKQKKIKAKDLDVVLKNMNKRPDAGLTD